MALLMAASAIFSCGEAALFSLTRQQRARLREGGKAEQFAADLLKQPNRLLTVVLFWNLLVNMAFFALSSVVSLRLSKAAEAGLVPSWSTQAFAMGSLLSLIVASELLPKSIGVLHPLRLAPLLAPLLRVAVRVLDPVFPLLQAANDACARVFFPRLQPEPYLELNDLEKAVDLGSHETYDNEPLLIQERQVVQRVVELADSTAQDLMRPRRRCLVLHPPVSLSDLVGQADGVGEYVLVTEPDSDEIGAALPLSRLGLLPPDRLHARAEAVVYTPWCASAAATLTLLRTEGRRVAAVLNELGETIGIVTIEQLLDHVLRDTSRVDPNDIHSHILRPVDQGAWMVSGSTPLRRLAYALRRLPIDEQNSDTSILQAASEAIRTARSSTVGGLLVELLHRSPLRGDDVRFAGLRWRVVTGPLLADDGASDEPLTIRLSVAPPEGSTSSESGGAGR
ncbi:hypothetical protein Pla111_29830 [Botrimarina hoheduenensis]|uniref:CNNM transmembrane domain-containing protein n=2 Tax=Botrimarina hoheduenensis TaxID=2528000 RepID=A0A5C5VSJ6_9BACT|nr:hypothetical protein Pla111_29830 [Botrimarina hoheduenensis]